MICRQIKEMHVVNHQYTGNTTEKHCNDSSLRINVYNRAGEQKASFETAQIWRSLNYQSSVVVAMELDSDSDLFLEQAEKVSSTAISLAIETGGEV